MASAVASLAITVFKAVPFTVIASASSVPSMSASPDISSVAASSSPLIVIFLPPLMSLFESVMIALLAITVPFVMPSIKLISAALAVIETPPTVDVNAIAALSVPLVLVKVIVSATPTLVVNEMASASFVLDTNAI